jgi:hypothetical protein
MRRLSSDRQPDRLFPEPVTLNSSRHSENTWRAHNRLNERQALNPAVDAHLRGDHSSLLDQLANLVFKWLELRDQQHQQEKVAVGDAHLCGHQRQFDAQACSTTLESDLHSNQSSGSVPGRLNSSTTPRESAVESVELATTETQTVPNTFNTLQRT